MCFSFFKKVKLMQEECILINDHDKKIGAASKKICHSLDNINKGMLHRAFSVFLFNTRGQLLLQQRANEKITFPNHFTNTCCSHPLNIINELDETENIGVKKAAQRKLKHELGIEPEQVPLEDFKFLTRIHYKSPNVPFDGKWGEHEIDYILFIQRDVEVKSNLNEVKSYRYVTPDELRQFLAEADRNGHLITPWFKLIVDEYLFKWWDHLDDLKSQEDCGTIHRMIKK